MNTDAPAPAEIAAAHDAAEASFPGASTNASRRAPKAARRQDRPTGSGTPERLLGAVETARVGGMTIARLSRSETASLVRDLVAAEPPAVPVYMTSANGQVLSEYSRFAETRALFDAADLVSADGQPMVLASRLLARGPLPERVATTDLYHDVSAIVPRGTRYFLLGSTPEEVARAAAVTRRLYPHIDLVGAHDGYIAAEDEARVVARIAALAPDVLWICMGVPREQAFVMRHREALAPVKVIKTGGGLFNFLSGSRSRAPLPLQRLGLEWAWRTIQEPRRLFRRYLVTNAHSILLLTLRTR